MHLAHDQQLSSHPVLDLSANENPLGPSPKVASAINQALQTLHRYPSRDGDELREALAGKFQVEMQHIVLGNGATELLDLAARSQLQLGDEAIIGVPSFMPYQKVVARSHAIASLVSLTNADQTIEALLQAVTPKTRMIIIGNPNNPTGTILTQPQLDHLLERLPAEVLVVLDEAYCEYVRHPDFPESLDYVRAQQNVLVLRSLSKAYGLAGLRIGYGIGKPALIEKLNGARQHFNTNSLAQAAALAALNDDQHLFKTLASNGEGLDFLSHAFGQMGLPYFPSEANFLLVRVGNGAKVIEGLAQQGIRVKAMERFGLPEYIRVSIGTPRQNWRLVQALSFCLESQENQKVTTPTSSVDPNVNGNPN